MTTVHSLPALMFLVNWMQMDCVIAKGHSTGLNLLGITYSICNCIQTKYSGIPVYPFLNWEDYTSPIIVGVTLLVFNLSFSTFVKFSYFIKPHMKPAKCLLPEPKSANSVQVSKISKVRKALSPRRCYKRRVSDE